MFKRFILQRFTLQQCMLRQSMYCSTLVACVTSSVAQAGFQSIGEADAWLLGGGISGEIVPYRQADAFDVSLQPYIAYEWDHLHLGIDGVVYEFYQAGDWTLSLDAKPMWSPYEAKDSEVLKGLKRSSALDAGMSVHYLLANHLKTQWYWQGQYLTDISGTYHDDSLSTSLGFHKIYAQHAIDVSLGVKKNSLELNQYLYGIEADEVQANRPQYKAKASFDPFVEIDLHYELGDSSLLITQLDLEYLSAEVRDSPIVDQKWQASVLVGWVRFF